MADQAVVSLGNFLTGIVLARVLSPQQYGTFVVLLGVLLFFVACHAALVTYPLSVRGAPADKEGLLGLVRASLWLTFGVGLTLGLGILAVCWILGTPNLGLWAAIALFCWIVQETTRRALMTHMRHGDALWGDAISYLGQVLTLVVLIRRGTVSVENAFEVIAVSSLLAAIVQAAQLGLNSLSPQRSRETLEAFWPLGRWMLLNSVLGVFCVQFFPWVLGLLRGTAQAGALQALVNVINFTNPVIISTVNLITPAASKAWSDSGWKAASQAATRYGAQGAVLVFPYLLIAMLWPRYVLLVLYGSVSPYAGLTSGLRVLVAAHFLYYVAVMMAALLNAIEQVRINFFILFASALLSVLVGVPLIQRLGVLGGALAIALGVLARGVALSVAVFQDYAAPRPPQAVAWPGIGE